MKTKWFYVIIFFIIALYSLIVTSCGNSDAPNTVVLSVKLAPTSPVAQSVVVSKQLITSDIVVLEFAVKTSEIVSINSLPVAINSSINLSELINDVKLQIGNTVHAVSYYAPAEKTGTITFNDFSSPINITGDNPVNIKVIIDVKPINLTTLVVIKASVQASKVVVFDENHKQLYCYKTGSAVGSDLTFINN